jgi:hypothetical protein
MGGREIKGGKVTRSNEDIYGEVQEVKGAVIRIEENIKDMATKTWVRGKLSEQKALSQEEEIKRLLAEGTSKINTSHGTSSTIPRARARVLDAKARVYIAIAGVIGIAGTMLVMWVASL